MVKFKNIAMKMEHTLSAPADGVVAEFFFAAGDLVSQGAELLRFEADEEAVTETEA